MSRTPDSEKQARKRASDREAQRKIRARTKQYINHMEQTLAQSTDHQWRDQTLRELLQRNETMENELLEMKRCLRGVEDTLTHCLQSQPHLQQMTGTNDFRSPLSDAMSLFVSRAESSSSPGHSQNFINDSYFPRDSSSSHRHSISVPSNIPNPSLANYLTDCTPSTPYHVLTSPGTSNARSYPLDPTCPYYIIDSESTVSARNATDSAQLPIYPGHNGRNHCNLA